MSLTQHIKQRALELGFDLIGVAPAGRAARANAYARWVEDGYAGEMAYMTRDPERRSDVRRVMPEARSVIVVGLNHYSVELPDEVKHDPSRGLIARYAWGLDYHDVMTPRLRELREFIRSETISNPTPLAHTRPSTERPVPGGPPRRSRGYGLGRLARSGGQSLQSLVYVDTGPILERDFAGQAGLGFVGKNTCLIHPRMGSWLFLGEIIVDVELDYDSPISHLGCGRCTRCLSACPTGAFPAPYVLDAQRCISYLTIELKGGIPRDLRPLMGNRIFGCDECQDVCPWPRRFARPTDERTLYPLDLDRAAPKLLDLIQLTDPQFNQRFNASPILRAKRRGLLRNVAVALGNWGDEQAAPALIAALDDDEPLVRGHAAWALGRIGTSAALRALETRYTIESDLEVQREIAEVVIRR